MLSRGGIVVAFPIIFYACSGGNSVGSADASGSAGSGGNSAGGRGGSTAGVGGSSNVDAGAAGARGGGGHGEAGASGSTGGNGVAGHDAGLPEGGQQDGPTSDGGTSASFAQVQAIFATTCVRCHDPAHPVVPETQTYVALSLTMKDAYASLVNRAATEMCGGTLVKPADPSKSYLYAKITQDVPCDGERMPHQGMIRTPPLPTDQIAIIEGWIQGGAKP